MPQNKVISLGDVIHGDRKVRLIVELSPIGEMFFQKIDLQTGAILPEELSMDAVATVDLFDHLKAFYQGEYEGEMHGL